MGSGRGKQAAGGESDEASFFLPGGLAGCPLFIHSEVMSGSGQWPPTSLPTYIYIFNKYFETKSHVAPAGLELTVWMKMT